MKQDLSSVPLWPIFAGMTAGIIIGIVSAISPWWSLAAVSVAVVCFVLRHHVIAIVVLAVAVGWIDASLNEVESFPDEMDGHMAWYKGVVHDVRDGMTSRRIVVSIGECGADSSAMVPCRRFKAALFVGSILPQITSGDMIIIETSLTRPEYDPDIPYEMSPVGALAIQGIEAVGFVSPSDISVDRSDGVMTDVFARMRLRCSDMLLRSSLGEDTATFVNAILLGDTSLLPGDVRRDFASAGLAHLLALSGMHVAVIAMVISVALFPLKVLRYDGLRHVITIVLLWLYALMTGMSPSVVRAVVMATILLTGHILDRQSSPLNNLCIAAIAILLFDPMALMSPGFQLSFAAVIAILTITPSFNMIDRRKHPWLYLLVSWVVVCVAAVLGTGMLAAYYFHTYPIYFLFGNLIAVFVMPVLMGSSFILLISEALGFDPLWLCYVIDLMYDAVSSSARAVSSLPGAVLGGLYFPAWILIPYYASIVSLVLFIERRRIIYISAASVCAAGTIVSLCIVSPELPQSEYFITRNPYRTDMIIRHGVDAYLFTTAPLSDRMSVAEECMRRYDGYFGRAGANRLQLLPDSCTTGIISRCGSLLSVGPDTYLLLDRNVPVSYSGMHVKYALVCRGYAGTMDGIGHVADTVLLSRDIDIRRHNRYIRQLQNDSVPYRSLRETAFHRILCHRLVSKSYPCLK